MASGSQVKKIKAYYSNAKGRLTAMAKKANAQKNDDVPF